MLTLSRTVLILCTFVYTAKCTYILTVLDIEKRKKDKGRKTENIETKEERQNKNNIKDK